MKNKGDHRSPLRDGCDFLDRQRKMIRLHGYDYSQNGAYFVTVCVKDRHCLLWEEKSLIRPEIRNDYIYTPDFELSEIGLAIENEIEKFNTIYKGVRIDNYCIMPDHIHMSITIEQDAAAICGCHSELTENNHTPDIPRIMKQFKGKITKNVGFSFWQKSYYDRIIRNEEEYEAKWLYINDNPRRWLWKEHG